MHLSKRLSALKPSPTVALNTKASALAKQGAPVVNLTVGEPDMPTPQAIVDVCVNSLRQGHTKYRPAGGSDFLREAVCQKLQRENNFSYEPDQIVVGIGAKEILLHTFMSILSEGDEVLLPVPYWVSYPEQIKASGGIAVDVPMPTAAGTTLNLAEIKRRATPRTVALVLNSPNNPSGYVSSEEELTELAAFLRTTDWWIISDEIYEYLAFDKKHISLLNIAPDLKDRFILINGLSKSFAMTGWRVGYAAGPKPVISMIKAMQSHSSTCIPGFIEEAAAFALKQGQPLMAEGIKSVLARRDLCVRRFSESPAVKFMKPEGAFYVFLDIRDYIKGSTKIKSSFEFCEKLLSELHVATVPGEAFGATGFLRLSYTTNVEKLEVGITKIKQALQNFF